MGNSEFYKRFYLKWNAFLRYGIFPTIAKEPRAQNADKVIKPGFDNVVANEPGQN
ncbi:MAG: hypothetical protein AAF363_21630 [Bacteroidota bacterium]